MCRGGLLFLGVGRASDGGTQGYATAWAYMGVCHNMGVHSVGVHGGTPIPLIDVLYLVIGDG